MVRPSNSPWAAPVVLARKKDGTWRFCVDYRGLNAVTIRDMYPLPRIDDALDALAGSKFFTTLDAWTGYWQMEIKEEDKEKTAFVTQCGQYKFNCMPFGLVNAPASFQRAMNLVLHGLTWQTCLVYLDDVIIFSTNFEEHLQRLGIVLDRFKVANIRLKIAKCNFCADSVEYLGHQVSGSGVEPNRSKIERMANMAPPRSTKEVHTFLGMAGYYRRFIKNFAEIVHPLQRLLIKDVPFTWGAPQQLAFDVIIEKLTTAPVLQFPNFERKFTVQPDACLHSIGVVLSQIGDDGLEHPVAYYSRLLKKHELRYSVPEKECLGVLEGIWHFRPYLWGREFTVVSDHRSLQWLFKTKDTNERLYRWFLKLAHDGFDYQVVHRPGKDHGNADGLSRLMCKGEVDSLPVMAVTPEDERCLVFVGVVEKSEAEDIYLGLITEAINSVHPMDDAVTKEESKSAAPAIGTRPVMVEQATQVDSTLTTHTVPINEEQLATQKELKPENSTTSSPNTTNPEVVDKKELVLGTTSEPIPTNTAVPTSTPIMEREEIVMAVATPLVTTTEVTINTPNPKTPAGEEEEPVSQDLEYLHNEQMRCRITSALIKFIQQGAIPKENNLKTAIMQEGKNLTVMNGILYRIASPESSVKKTPRLQAVLPVSMRKEALTATHDSLIGGGHLNYKKTYAKVTERWWWPGVYKDTKHWVESCTTCAQMHRDTTGPKGPMQSISAREPFETIGMDVVGEFPRTANGNRFILVMTDYHTKWAIAVPLKEVPSKAVARALLHHLILAGHGAPRRIITDQGSNFNSALAREVYQMLSIAKSTTSAYHPQCDGQTEKLNDTLCRMISKLMLDYPEEWDELIPYATFGYNTSIHSSTGLSPVYMLYGREPRLPIDHTFSHVDYPSPTKPSTYVQQLQDRLIEAYQIANQRLDKAQEAQKARYDAKSSHSLNPFPPGCSVYVKDMSKPAVGTSKKFKTKYFGPCTVLDRTGPTNYLVRGENFPEQIVHVWRLRAAVPRKDMGDDIEGTPIAKPGENPATDNPNQGDGPIPAAPGPITATPSSSTTIISTPPIPPLPTPPSP